MFSTGKAGDLRCVSGACWITFRWTAY